MAYINRARVWSRKKQFHRAIADYSEAIRLDPAFAVAYNDRGMVWSEKQEFDKAIADYGQAIRHDPRDAFAHINRSVVQMILRHGDAVAGFKTVLKLQRSRATFHGTPPSSATSQHDEPGTM